MAPSKDPFYGSGLWKQQRARVFARDGYRCRLCKRLGKQAGGSVRLIADHHVVKLRVWVGWGRLREDYPDHFMRTLCDKCSGKADGGHRYAPPVRR